MYILLLMIYEITYCVFYWVLLANKLDNQVVRFCCLYLTFFAKITRYHYQIAIGFGSKVINVKCKFSKCFTVTAFC